MNFNQIGWSIIDMPDDIDSAIEAWNRVFSDVINRHAPIKKTRLKCLHAPWLTTMLSDAMRDNNANALWNTLNEITSRNCATPITCIEADGITTGPFTVR